MVKYLVDLPAETTAIVAKKPYFLNEIDVMRIPVSQLEMYVEPNASENATVEKRVIELPADVIAELKTIKEDNGDDNLQGFMNDVNDDDELWQDVERFNRSGMPTDALLGEWWLEHVEFVAKKEPRFVVETDSAYVEDYVFLGANVSYLNVHNVGFINDLDDENITDGTFKAYFTESEADKIVADLGGENGLLQARKVKVEE